jgi:hypothetical protein
MRNLTTQQMAELLVGIARAQHAVIEALENSSAGFKSKHFRPALESASRIRSNQPETLADFPSRVLLGMLGRNAPDAAQVARSLEALVAALEAAPPARTAEKPAAETLPDITAPEPEAPEPVSTPDNTIPFEAPPPVAAPAAAKPAPAADGIPFDPAPRP